MNNRSSLSCFSLKQKRTKRPLFPFSTLTHPFRRRQSKKIKVALNLRSYRSSTRSCRRNTDSSLNSSRLIPSHRRRGPSTPPSVHLWLKCILYTQYMLLGIKRMHDNVCRVAAVHPLNNALLSLLKRTRSLVPPCRDTRPLRSASWSTSRGTAG